MSAYYEIFLKTVKPFDEVIEDVGRAVGVELASEPSSNAVLFYRAVTDSSVIEVESSHAYEDDYGIEFSRFPIVITVRDLDSDKDREESTALSLLQFLAKDGGYAGLLVFDLKRRVAEI
ncbi:hypothetical protein ACIBCN_33205 [Nocardia sp. NPDC051052]|uniref:hypothetical protein n=1 Tax=Nocardia sp. NPDC051052 TaxID=3364322 RepID=UPI0037BB15A4